jgi:hypothetical protein
MVNVHSGIPGKYHYEGQTLEGITISTVLDSFPEHGSTEKQILQTADRALNQAKAEGRNCIIIAEISADTPNSRMGMKPEINSTRFGSITVEGSSFEHDIIIHLNGQISKRKKKLSKELFGTSHILSLPEAEHIYEKGAEGIIVGTGQFGRCKLSEEAEIFFKDRLCAVKLFPTNLAIKEWNAASGAIIGLFHITC